MYLCKVMQFDERYYDLPKNIKETGGYWIASFPVEFRHKHITEWAEQVGWEIKPTKNIRQRWRVAAEAPKDHLAANKIPLLIYLMTKNEVEVSKVMAGRIFTPKQLRERTTPSTKWNKTNQQQTVQVILLGSRDRNGMPDDRWNIKTCNKLRTMWVDLPRAQVPRTKKLPPAY